jgi:hypothetical protein
LAEYSIWKNITNLEYGGPWCKSPGDANHLFGLIKEHQAPPTPPAVRSNWIKPFQSSVDLMEQIRKDLSAPSSEALLQSLAEKGAMPGIRIKSTGSENKPQTSKPGEYTVKVTITNYGASTAYDVRVRLRQHDSKDSRYVGLGNPIAPNASISQNFKVLQTSPHPDPYAFIDVEYRIDRGWLIQELFTMDQNLKFGYRGKKLVERATILSRFPDDPWKEGTGQ